MNRRNFLSRFGLGAAAAVAVPSVILGHGDQVSDQEWEEIDLQPKSNASWGTAYQLDVEPQVWEELHKAYGGSIIDWEAIRIIKT